MAKRFQRVTEDFDCASCGAAVAGDGYTNHCPRCLVSLHVDVNPGDRAAGCGGLMNPVKAKRDGRKGVVVLHRCERCGHEKWNRAAAADNAGELLGLLSS